MKQAPMTVSSRLNKIFERAELNQANVDLVWKVIETSAEMPLKDGVTPVEYADAVIKALKSAILGDETTAKAVITEIRAGRALSYEVKKQRLLKKLEQYSLEEYGIKLVMEDKE